MSYSEKLYFDSESYFSDLIADLNNATKSISIEMYIWAAGHLSDRLYSALSAAAARGVKVRVLVDGIGSYYWILGKMNAFLAAGIQARVFHPLPWPFSSIFKFAIRGPLKHLNRRNHRKIFIIDEKVAYTGSINVMEEALSWRETGLRISGQRVQSIEQSFRHVWLQSGHRIWRWVSRHVYKISRSWDFVRTNQTFRLRRRLHADFIHRVRSARQRVWIMTPYFVPPGNILHALRHAARRGVDVRLILPKRSDLLFMPWIIRLYYRYLLEAGVKIFEFTHAILHAKETLIDDWGMVGSSNLNHRSLLRDLELDIVLTDPGNVMTLEKKFIEDMHHSQQIVEEPQASFRFVARILFNLRAWM